MSSLEQLVAERTSLSEGAADHLTRLVGEWQLLADLSFSDLLLLARAASGELVVLAQMRPYTSQTLYQDDQVGRSFAARDVPAAAEALAEGRIVREGEPVWRGGVPVRVEAVPVRSGGEVVAVISQETNLATARTPSRLELTYLRCAGDFARMISDGTFPFPGSQPDPEWAPRVGDGLVRLDAAGVVDFASPNAVSAYRRLGVPENLQGRRLAELDPEPRELVESLRHRRPSEGEVERRGAVVLRRSIPIVVNGEVRGGVVLLRDVTDLRRRDRMLLVKDATIREIHHRVKNNLQTVASLLRIQGRRLVSAEAKEALQESERRIRSIAVVHETLSHESGDVVDFDRVAEQVVRMVEEGLAAPGVGMTVTGSCGRIAAEVATPLAVALAELLQNTVDHAFPDAEGRVAVTLGREDGRATIEVADDGRGLPEDFSLEGRAGLGLQIVRTLVESDLGGELVMENSGGTRARLTVPLGDFAP